MTRIGQAHHCFADDYAAAEFFSLPNTSRMTTARSRSVEAPLLRIQNHDVSRAA